MKSYFFRRRNGVFKLLFDEPVVSHDKPGAADHSSVERDVLFHPILSFQDFVLLTIRFKYQFFNIKNKNMIEFIADSLSDSSKLISQSPSVDNQFRKLKILQNSELRRNFKKCKNHISINTILKLFAVLSIHLILMRIRILDPHWKFFLSKSGSRLFL